MPRSPLRPVIPSAELERVIDELDERSGGSAVVFVVAEDGAIQLRHSGGPDAVRAAAGAALLSLRSLALPGAPTCSGCAARLREAEAALRALRVDERCWGAVSSDTPHLH